jgi:branched-chain amino acid aminotransferase
VLLEATQPLVEYGLLDRWLLHEQPLHRSEALLGAGFVEVLEELEVNSLLVRQSEAMTEKFVRRPRDRATPVAVHEPLQELLPLALAFVAAAGTELDDAGRPPGSLERLRFFGVHPCPGFARVLLPFPLRHGRGRDRSLGSFGEERRVRAACSDAHELRTLGLLGLSGFSSSSAAPAGSLALSIHRYRSAAARYAARRPPLPPCCLLARNEQNEKFCRAGLRFRESESRTWRIAQGLSGQRKKRHGEVVVVSDVPMPMAVELEHGTKYWRDGELHDRAGPSPVSLLTHTLHYGLGAFEGIRAYRRAAGETCIFRLDEHVARLFDSARLAFLVPRVTSEEVASACAAVLRANGMVEGYIRPLVILGEGAMGLLPTDNPVETYVMAWKWGAYLGADGLEKGIRCKVSSFSRHSVKSSLSRGKIIGAYVNSTLAKQEAKLGGYDEAILLDVNGCVSEGSGENVFIVNGGRISTPPLSSSILPGITRDTVMTLAREEGFIVAEELITRDAAYLADEMFLTGTAAEITPVRELDDRRIGKGSPGPATKVLQSRFFDVVRGRDDSHPEWLTRV